MQAGGGGAGNSNPPWDADATWIRAPSPGALLKSSAHDAIANMEAVLGVPKVADRAVFCTSETTTKPLIEKQMVFVSLGELGVRAI